METGSQQIFRVCRRILSTLCQYLQSYLMRYFLCGKLLIVSPERSLHEVHPFKPLHRVLKCHYHRLFRNLKGEMKNKSEKNQLTNIFHRADFEYRHEICVFFSFFRIYLAKCEISPFPWRRGLETSFRR